MFLDQLALAVHVYMDMILDGFVLCAVSVYALAQHGRTHVILCGLFDGPTNLPPTRQWYGKLRILLFSLMHFHNIQAH